MAPIASTVLIECSGADSDRARTQARGLLGGGCDAILSFGIAGGLDPDVEPGTVIISEEVIAPDGRRYPTDPAWRERVLAGLDGRLAPSRLTGGAVVGSSAVVATAAEKRALLYRTGAAAVDMESHCVAEVAAEAGARFMAIRAVADSAERGVPVSASQAIAEDGSERIGAVLGGLALRPWELPALIALARANARAIRALSGVALGLGPELGLG